MTVGHPSPFAIYSFRSDFDYMSYLERQSHFDHLSNNIDTSIAKLAFSNAQVGAIISGDIRAFSESMTDRCDDILSELQHGFSGIYGKLDGIRYSLSGIKESVDHVLYAVETGFKITEKRLEAIESIMRDILTAVESPEKTWALEKYEIAKDLYDRELYSDALSYLNDALMGHGEHRGYVFDPRIHLLKGAILIGDADNFEPNMIDFPAAKQSFEDAAKYAKPPKDKLRGADDGERRSMFQLRVYALCCSGWASYVMGSAAEAESCYRRALEDDSDSARAHYFLGKTLAYQGKSKESVQHLKKALEKQSLYAARAINDKDFLRYGDDLRRCIDEVRRAVIASVEPCARLIVLTKREPSLATDLNLGKDTSQLIEVCDDLLRSSLSLEEAVQAKYLVGPVAQSVDVWLRNVEKTLQADIEDISRQISNKIRIDISASEILEEFTKAPALLLCSIIAAIVSFLLSGPIAYNVGVPPDEITPLAWSFAKGVFLIGLVVSFIIPAKCLRIETGKEN